MPPRPGEVWTLHLSPAVGHEQAGRRPALVVSVDKFNSGPAELLIVAPLTSTDRGQPLHVRIEPPEGGVRETSFIKAEDVRSVSTSRLLNRWGSVESATLRGVTRRISLLLGRG